MKRQEEQHKKLILGVTGGFGTGKSTVAGFLKSKITKIIDADRIAHQLINPGTAVYRKIVSFFGKGVLGVGKKIDRAKLAKLVFDDPRLLSKLNAILHPAVIKIIRKEIKSSKKNLIVLDVPLLFEAGLRSLVDKVVVVKAKRKAQLGRLEKSRSLKEKDILKRINAQMPLLDKVRLADFVIDNSGSIVKTKAKVLMLRRMLWKN